LFCNLLAAQPRSWRRPASITNLAAGQTYYIQGWTILQTSDSATSTSDATGHGMTVTVHKNKGDPRAQEVLTDLPAALGELNPPAPVKE
jgi:hypothetical protein